MRGGLNARHTLMAGMTAIADGRATVAGQRAGGGDLVARMASSFKLRAREAILSTCLIATCWAGRWNRAVPTH